VSSRRCRRRLVSPPRPLRTRYSRNSVLQISNRISPHYDVSFLRTRLRGGSRTYTTPTASTGRSEISKCLLVTHCHCGSHHHLPMDQCDEVLSSVYNYSWDSTQPQDHHRTLHQHAVVFVFLATASLFDPQLPPRVSLCLSLRSLHRSKDCCQSIEASRYYELACAALAGTRVNTDPTLEAVQALVRNVDLSVNDAKINQSYSVSYLLVRGPASLSWTAWRSPSGLRWGKSYVDCSAGAHHTCHRTLVKVVQLVRSFILPLLAAEVLIRLAHIDQMGLRTLTLNNLGPSLIVRHRP
jgi:hypothetical protein